MCEPRKAVALGLFDGVHLGHRAVLQAAVESANHGFIPAAFTMQTNSVTVKRGEPLQYLYPDVIKQQLLFENKIELILNPSFPEISSMDGETFCRIYMKEQMHAGRLFCGRDFRFGRQAAWGVAELEQFGEQFGFTVTCVEAVEQDGAVISSSRIRQLLQNGELDAANRLLGQPYQIFGSVQHGAAVGRTMRFPTINLPFLEGQLVPYYGVYHSRVTLKDNSVWEGLTDIGVKPTVSKDAAPAAETYLLDYAGNLYGQTCRVELLEFLRKEQTFSSKKELKAAIMEDVRRVRKSNTFQEFQIKFPPKKEESSI